MDLDVITLNRIFSGAFALELIEEMVEHSTYVKFKEGDVLIDYNQYIRGIPLLIEGAIKILRDDDDAGELLLYVLEKGESCAVTMSCCVGNAKSEIRAIAEKNGVVAMVPAEKMEEWIRKYHSWRVFVLDSYQARFNELLSAVDNIAFKHMDERLMEYLKKFSDINKSNVIRKTHQEIANELNTSRVVISRLLKALENEGIISLGRSSITLNPETL